MMQRLAERPFANDFFQAVRLLESRYPGFPRIGHSQALSQDPVRFWQNPSLAFAPSTIEALEQAAPETPPKLAVRFFGLFGPNAPLPPHLTEYALERQLHYGDRTLTAFLNVFHHRLLSFFYCAWATNQKAVDLDRPDNQRFAAFIGSFLGIGMDALQQRDAVPDPAKLFFSGRLACQTRNAEGLEAILQDFFAVKTEVQSFIGRWLALPPENVCNLGGSPETGCLGATTIVGSRFWDCQLSFRIRMGPMKLHDFERMLPVGQSFPRLKCWVLNYSGEQFFWEVQLVLEAQAVPDTCLGRAGRLGWTTWLKTKPFDHDADDLILQPPLN